MRLSEATIGTLLKEKAAQYPNQDAAIFHADRVRYTWEEIDVLTQKIARAFLAIGVKPGTHVALWANNIPEWLFVQYALARIGAVLVTLNPEWKRDELAFALQQSEADVLVMCPGFVKQSGQQVHHYDYIGIVKSLCPNITEGACEASFPLLKKIILTPGANERGMLNWQDFLTGAQQVSDQTLQEVARMVAPHDPVMIQYTSGTTGFPKGAVLTHYNVINNARITAGLQHLGPGDLICGPVPFYHCFGSILLNLGSLVSGAAIVIPDHAFNSQTTLSAIAQYRCTALFGVPTMFIAMLALPDFAQYDLRTLRTGIMAGAPVDRELFEAVTQKMGARKMTIAYGLTEASPVTHQTCRSDPEEKRFGTVGKPIEHTQAKILDPITQEDVPDGEIGEIVVSGFHVMAGYYNNPEATAKTMHEGWLRTGDLGLKDPEGYYRIVGRLKEMIIVGGHNVYPAEVEQSLHTIFEAEVELLQVVSVPHPVLQEVAGLVVKLKPGKHLSLEEVKSRCEGKLEWPKIPRHLKVVKDFSPYMTVTGKIQKFKLSELFASSLVT